MRGRIAFVATMITGALVLVVDQLTKAWAVDALSSGQSRPVVGDLIRFHLAFNTGAAFSSGTGATWIFTAVSGVAAIAIVIFAWRVRSIRWAMGLGVLLGGAASHFGDRLLRGESLGNGYVIDFIDYLGLFIGNVADIAIVGAVVYLALLAMTGVPWGAARAAQADQQR
ncbi:signal peptidase II [Leifsonia sp. ku-ls]|nr:signal peptidase II [Leifsonia sp. ku-ls]